MDFKDTTEEAAFRTPGPNAGQGAIPVPETEDAWWAHLDSNQEPWDYESPALTVELWAQTTGHPRLTGLQSPL